MSFIIPMIFFYWKLPEITLMSVKISVRTLSVENSKVNAMLSADGIVMASGIRDELMKISTVDPWIRVPRPEPEKTHPNPAVKLSLFQAAFERVIGACLTRS